MEWNREGQYVLSVLNLKSQEVIIFPEADDVQAICTE